MNFVVVVHICRISIPNVIIMKEMVNKIADIPLNDHQVKMCEMAKISYKYVFNIL